MGWIGGLVQTGLYCDFFYYYAKSSWAVLSSLGLSVACHTHVQQCRPSDVGVARNQTPRVSGAKLEFGLASQLGSDKARKSAREGEHVQPFFHDPLGRQMVWQQACPTSCQLRSSRRSTVALAQTLQSLRPVPGCRIAPWTKTQRLFQEGVSMPAFRGGGF